MRGKREIDQNVCQNPSQQKSNLYTQTSDKPLKVEGTITADISCNVIEANRVKDNFNRVVYLSNLSHTVKGQVIDQPDYLSDF